MINVIKQIFLDISLLYKNFLHWNISKILIFIASVLLGILLSLPFFIILAVIVFFDPIEWKEIIYNYYTTGAIGLSFMTALSAHLLYIIIESIFFLTGVTFFILGTSYKIVTMTKLNLDYLSGENTSYTKNIYFDFSKFFKYLGIISWIGLILLIPVLIFVILFFIILFSFGGVDQVSEMVKAGYLNGFSILSLTSFLICFLALGYMAYRMNFSYIIMLDEKNYPEVQKALYYVKESFKITSGLKFFSFLLVLIIFTLVIFPIDYFGKYLEESGNLLQFLYGVIVFLLLNGVFEMLVVSVYKNIMLDKKDEIV